ncbi:MAG: hypothetical protein A2340_14390 [Lentisphaerae bacterium RIFOXYB12_FULL_60_10]|nr:MAG: hypothetical protein A2340_14390 [Lentisphaerae bacterium RIFOXYB12_FULL_60_10]
MNQLAMGMSVAWLIGIVVYARNRGKVSHRFFWITPLCMLLVGLWAIIPDLPRLAGDTALYHRMAHNPRMDIFLFHYTIDQIESDAPWGMALLAIQAISLQIMQLLNLRQIEKGPRP